MVPTWPVAGQACVRHIADFLPERLRDDLVDPHRCLLPVDMWPRTALRSKVHASDEEWYSLVKAGAERSLFAPVPLASVFCGFDGQPVLHGAMGVDKFKEEGGIVRRFLRFIHLHFHTNQSLFQAAQR